MPRFRKKAPVKQEIPTAALPDIIFILLFFFMVATKPRPQEPKVAIETPQATEIQKVPEQMETIDLHVGIPKDQQKFGSSPVIQAGEKFVSPNALPGFMQEKIAGLPMQKRQPSRIMVNLKIDKGVNVGIINDIEQKLKAMGLLNINYTSAKRSEEL